MLARKVGLARKGYEARGRMARSQEPASTKVPREDLAMGAAVVRRRLQWTGRLPRRETDQPQPENRPPPLRRRQEPPGGADDAPEEKKQKKEMPAAAAPAGPRDMR